MATSGQDANRWRIKNPSDLEHWAFRSEVSDRVAVLVLEFYRDRVGADPDFGEVIAEHTRGELIPETNVEAIWTFDPKHHYFEVIAPRSTD